ncbi:hypothetical protein EST38_g2023 [Candolleomyces aberdarensis]|uniref:F-box domain-containing protein n=1 Tax=Candolleomyces aberdarensis TaxID=2316362 RepID=A0A4Q2DXU5_9AGAR|nr:hypothetical protein EST38_g2023 [Candolleomyces aberdarensis]
MASPLLLMEMPIEVLQRVFAYCHPREASMFSQASRAAYNLIYFPDDQYLWRQLYLNYPFDHPEVAEHRRLEQKVNFSSEPQPINYSERLIGLIKAEKAASNPPPTTEEETDALNAFISLAQELPVYSDTDCLSLNVDWLEKTLENAPLLTQPHSTHSPNDDQGERESLRARLRCYLRSSFKDTEATLSKTQEEFFVTKRNRSRCFVYDLRNYTSESRWGPFTPDNRVNWVHVEHLMNVVWMNLCEYPLRTLLRPRIGVSAVRPHSATGNYLTDDWAGVEGDHHSCCIFSPI